MAGIIKTFIRVGVITTAAAGVAVLIAGPERAAALVSQAHDKIMEQIDSRIEDPVALRNQLKELEREYPQRIAQVRGDLAELQEQMRQLDREQSIAERVVALADGDLQSLKPLLAEAESTSAEQAAGSRIRNVTAIRFDNKTYSIEQAYTRANQISHTRVAYANRAADAAHDLVYLKQQAERLEELLMKLEAERAQFQAQLFQLDRQVDAIARNEKLIDMLEKRQRTIDECGRYEVANLDQMVARLSEVRARQQAELDLLTGDAKQLDYEEVARMQLGTEQGLIDLGSSGDDAVVQQSVYRTVEQPKLR